MSEPRDEGLQRLLTEGEGVHLGSRQSLAGVQSEQRGQEGHGVPVETGIIQPGHQFTEPLLRRLVWIEAEQLLEHAPDRPERDIAVIRRTVGLQHRAVLVVHVRRQRLGQRRLPDAGGATNDGHRLVGPRRAIGVVDETLPGEAEEPALTLASDQGHRLGESATRRRDGQVRTHHVVQLHRARDALERTRPDRLQLKVRFDQLPGGVADDHGAGFGLALQARRHVGGRPREIGAVEDPRVQPGDHDGARMDADAEGRLDAVATLQLAACVRHAFDEPQSGHHRAPRVVLVRGGVAEARTTPSPWNWSTRPPCSSMVSATTRR